MRTAINIRIVVIKFFATFARRSIEQENVEIYNTIWPIYNRIDIVKSKIIENLQINNKTNLITLSE